MIQDTFLNYWSVINNFLSRYILGDSKITTKDCLRKVNPKTLECYTLETLDLLVFNKLWCHFKKRKLA